MSRDIDYVSYLDKLIYGCIKEISFQVAAIKELLVSLPKMDVTTVFELLQKTTQIVVVCRKYPLLASVVAVNVVVITFIYRRYTFWSRQGVPGPRAIPPFGNLLNYTGASVREIEKELVDKYGSLVGTYQGFTPVLLVADPAVVKQVLVKDFNSFNANNLFMGHRVIKNWMLQQGGEEWKKVRGIVTPSFTTGKLRAMLPLIDKAVEALFARLDREIEGKGGGRQTVDIKPYFTALGMDVITNVAFAATLNPQENPNDPAVRHALGIGELPKWKFFVHLLMPFKVMELLKFGVLNTEHLNYLVNLVKAMITQKREEKKKGIRKRPYKDFLDLFLEAADDNKEFTENQVISNSFLIFLAGFETTTVTMMFLHYMLSFYPDWQEKCYQEVRGSCEANGSQWIYESLAELQNLESFISENLRVHPPLVRFDRIATKDVQLDNGIFIPKGTVMRFPLYALHTSKAYWSDPLTFRPERFLPENSKSIVPYSYIPFVEGPRICLGKRFGKMEATYVTSKFLMRYKFSRPLEEKEGWARKNASFLIAPACMYVDIEKRTS